MRKANAIEEMIAAKCWICGNPADSREHKSQKSDIKAVFGTPNQQSPFFFNSDTIKNKRIGGLKNKLTMFEKSLCHSCNTAKTQPYDEAWSVLSEVLRTRIPKITGGQIIRCNRIFPYDTARKMLNVHLFFCKKFGCHIIEEDIKPIDINEFATSILEDRPHPNVYLRFGPTPPDTPIEMVANSHMKMEITSDGQCAFAVWEYIVGRLTVQVMYAKAGERRDGLINSWHPKSANIKRIHITSF